MNIVLTCNYYSFTIIILQFFDCNITIVILQLNYNNINSIIQGYISQIYWIQTFIESTTGWLNTKDMFNTYSILPC